MILKQQAIRHISVMQNKTLKFIAACLELLCKQDIANNMPPLATHLYIYPNTYTRLIYCLVYSSPHYSFHVCVGGKGLCVDGRCGQDGMIQLWAGQSFCSGHQEELIEGTLSSPPRAQYYVFSFFLSCAALHHKTVSSGWAWWPLGSPCCCSPSSFQCGGACWLDP